MTKSAILIIQVLILLTGCNVFKKTPKQELTDGFYIQRINNEKRKIYVAVADETIQIYRTIHKEKSLLIDTTQAHQLYLATLKQSERTSFSLSRASLDLDFLTIPLKFRFSQKFVPQQLNSNINGAFFLGYRTDRYALHYQHNPLMISERKIIHFGYSIGIFTGLGNTFMSPTNTNNMLSEEYDAMVWNKGVAGILGINNFTLGLGVGLDNLLDRNRKTWIYEGKPYIGLVFGLNLN